MSERPAEPVGPPGPVRARLMRAGMMRAVQRDERGEALPAAILFLGVLFTVLVGVHVVLVAMARTAVQSAADAAVAAAQAAGPGQQECDGDMTTTETVRECEGILRARVAMAASDSSVVETRLPAVVVEPERGVVTVLVFGGTISPVFGGIELTAQACGPLDDVPAAQLDGTDIWRC
ncbi:MAG: hypothetical protein OXJ37_01655 [Bryobacterales bacterium]|nr:hypothetical protein [Bryobacterales bacterium]